jgi:hypothetical protein
MLTYEYRSLSADSRTLSCVEFGAEIGTVSALTDESSALNNWNYKDWEEYDKGEYILSVCHIHRV